LEKYPVEEHSWKAKIIGLIIRIEVMQGNDYWTSHHASPDGNRERQMNNIGGNSIGELRQLSQVPHISRESAIWDINGDDSDSYSIHVK
jgi:hypothetical protein